MDKLLDQLFDPKIILAALAGWTLHEIVTSQRQRSAASGMAGTILERQAGVARSHAAKRFQDLADDRTKQVVDSLFPRPRTKQESNIIQLTVPR